MSRDISESPKLKYVPEKRRGSYLAAIRGEASPRRAIKAFCEHCQGYSPPLAETIRTCPAYDCPLYQYRPYQPKLTGQDLSGQQGANP